MVIDLNLVCTESFRVYLAYVYVYCTVQTVYLYRMFSRGRSEPWSERPSADLELSGRVNPPSGEIRLHLQTPVKIFSVVRAWHVGRGGDGMRRPPCEVKIALFQ